MTSDVGSGLNLENEMCESSWQDSIGIINAAAHDSGKGDVGVSGHFELECEH